MRVMGMIDGKVAIVTGSGRGIGAASARKLGAEGAAEELIDQELHVFVGRGYLATLRHGSDPFPLDVVKRRWRAQPEVCCWRTGFIRISVQRMWSSPVSRCSSVSR